MEEFEDYYPLVYKLRMDLNFTIMEIEDYFQEAYLTFEKSVKRYNGRYSFGVFFKKNLKNRMLEILRNEMADKRRANYFSVSFEEDYGVSEENNELLFGRTTDLHAISNLFLRLSTEEWWGRLTKKESEVFTKILTSGKDELQTLSLAERQHMYGIKKKLKEFLCE